MENSRTDSSPNTSTTILSNIRLFTLKNSKNPSTYKKPMSDDDRSKFSDITFKDYLEKFDMKKHAERLVKQNQSRRMSSGEYLTEFIESIDPTDDLLRIRVEPGNPKLVNEETRRQINHTYKILGNEKSRYDKWNLKPRFLELMKQSIYEIRNRMVPMQIYRKMFRDTPLYRMGYLTSRIDSRVKTFSKFAWLAFRMCGITRQSAASVSFRPIDVLPTIQKQLEMRVDILLLIELLQDNAEEARLLMAKYDKGRRERFMFVEEQPADEI